MRLVGDRAVAAEGATWSASGRRSSGDLGHRACAEGQLPLTLLPCQYRPHTTIYNYFNRWSQQRIWEGHGRLNRPNRRGDGVDRQHAYQGALPGKRRKRGALAQAIGRSCGGHTTKVHALTNKMGRPRTLVLTPGNAHDLHGERDLLDITGAPRRLLADPE
jgi:transposase